MLNEIYQNTIIYTSRRTQKKEKGQFFTSRPTAEFMASYVNKQSKLSILDAGAGNGALAAAIVEQLVVSGYHGELHITFVENDKDILTILNNNIGIIEAFCSSNNIHVSISLVDNNFITSENHNMYDVVISNPPYKKIKKDSPESKAMSDVVYGQPNLYGLFMVKGLKLLREGGKFIYIVPRSWASGAYFKKVRNFVLDNLNITQMHLFESRDKAFTDENVLQETMIIMGEKSTKQNAEILISKSSDDKMIPLTAFSIAAKTIKGIGTEKLLLMPSSQEEGYLIQEIGALPDTFESLGYVFKTGPVVEFRNRNTILQHEENESVPMYRAANIANGEFVFPAQTEKAQFLLMSARALLIENNNTVLIRRLSAKEERHRLQSCVYVRTGRNAFISIENHVNYAARKDGRPLSIKEIEWIQSILSSEQYDFYFRFINGSTQVNAGDLNRLPVRRMA